MEIDKLPAKLSEIINKYSDQVKIDVEKRLDETAEKALDFIKKNCPKSNNGNNHLADSFVLTVVGSGANKTIFISSSTKGKLVHLIEFGFKHRSGRFVESRAFMRPAYDTFTPLFLEEVKKVIKGADGN